MEWSPRSAGRHAAAGLHRATHWLFSRLDGVVGVNVPDTALFDDEGVMDMWVFAKLANGSGKSKRLRPSYSVMKHNRTELSLLRLEAHLQDEGVRSSSPSGDVAVVYDDELPRALDEAQLDNFIRVLCARERYLTSDAANLSLPRPYPGGGFTLQAAVGGSGQAQLSRIRTTYEAAEEKHNRWVGGHCAHELKAVDGSDTRRSEDMPQDEWTSLVADAESQVAAIAKHLHTSHSVRVQRMELCFVKTTKLGLQLTCAELLEWAEETELAPNSKDQVTRRRAGERGGKHASRREGRGVNYRICRQCRLPPEMDLANELLRSQTLVRSVVAKHQDALLRHSHAEKEKELLRTELSQQQSQMESLHAEVSRLHDELARSLSEYDQLHQRNVELEAELQTVAAQRDQAQQEVVSALDTATELRHLHAAQLEKAKSNVANVQSEWKSRSDMTTSQLRQVQAEVQGLQLSNREWKVKFEEARAQCDEIRFQWGFVVRKLTDVGDKGVLPPKRVAGGFSSYPTPSSQNVELVVKWIVDYEAKRTVLDAQQQTKTGEPKTIRRRLRLKLELMRILAMSPRSQSRRQEVNRRETGCRSPSRKSSRSPSASPKKSSARRVDTATLFREQISVESQSTRALEARGKEMND